MVREVINDRVCIVLSHSKTKDEADTAKALSLSLAENGVAVGNAMMTKDSSGSASVMEHLLWFVTHPQTVTAGATVFTGSVLLLVEKWLNGDRNRSLKIEYDDYKIEAKTIEDLKEAVKLLPPPSTAQILEDGDMMSSGEVISKDDRAE
ncbi:hypothetical protein [Pseudosulfitobacter sp. SM2401]|uniref:hypothetical protein n=1 Tax=Pseudosulfitobacter sp. SM2401 TaxID=3350098 RepID=UPI0036F196C8